MTTEPKFTKFYPQEIEFPPKYQWHGPKLGSWDWQTWGGLRITIHVWPILVHAIPWVPKVSWKSQERNIKSMLKHRRMTIRSPTVATPATPHSALVLQNEASYQCSQKHRMPAGNRSHNKPPGRNRKNVLACTCGVRPGGANTEQPELRTPRTTTTITIANTITRRHGWNQSSWKETPNSAGDSKKANVDDDAS